MLDAQLAPGFLQQGEGIVDDQLRIIQVQHHHGRRTGAFFHRVQDELGQDRGFPDPARSLKHQHGTFGGQVQMRGDFGQDILASCEMFTHKAAQGRQQAGAGHLFVDLVRAGQAVQDAFDPTDRLAQGGKLDRIAGFDQRAHRVRVLQDRLERCLSGMIGGGVQCKLGHHRLPRAQPGKRLPADALTQPAGMAGCAAGGGRIQQIHHRRRQGRQGARARIQGQRFEMGQHRRRLDPGQGRIRGRRGNGVERRFRQGLAQVHHTPALAASAACAIFWIRVVRVTARAMGSATLSHPS